MQPGSIYHVFNHANGSENLFREKRNYEFFLEKIRLHICPVADIYAYCLMPNHFHLMVNIRSVDELRKAYVEKKRMLIMKATGINPGSVGNERVSEEELMRFLSKSFSNLFNSYSQAFNKLYKRMGSLFMQNMKRIELIGEEPVCHVVRYIHANPVHHGFVKNISDWTFSSYNDFLGQPPTWLQCSAVLSVFGGNEKFLKFHEERSELEADYER